MKKALPKFLLGCALLFGASAQAQYEVQVSGHVVPCTPGLESVTIQTIQGTQPPQIGEVLLNANCYYDTLLVLSTFNGWLQATVDCGGGESNASGQYEINPGTTSGSITLDLSCDVPLNCNADFTFEQATSGGALVPFTFITTNLSTGADPISYNWQWDGPSSTDPEPTHVIPDMGQEIAYGVCLTITDGAGCTSTQCDTIYVDTDGILYQTPPVPCQASWEYEQTAPFTLDMTSTSTGFGDISSFWNLPGENQSTWGDEVTVNFDGPGAYTVCLSANGIGCLGQSLCETFYVDEEGNVSTEPTPGDCEAGYWVIQAYDSSNGEIEPIPYELWVVNLSTGDGSFQFMWNFGDGNTSNQAYPTHVYAGSGPYELCLTMWDGSGCTDTYCDTVSVGDDGLFDGMMEEGDAKSNLVLNVIQPLSTSVQDKPAFEGVNAWPNPTSDLLNISLSSNIIGRTSVSIIDLNGRIVRTMDRTFSQGTNLLTIPVAELANGIYSIRIENGGNSTTHRFVKNQ